MQNVKLVGYGWGHCQSFGFERDWNVDGDAYWCGLKILVAAGMRKRFAGCYPTSEFGVAVVAEG